jgi:GPH family glycoside/pentoside/hexuronide:cation symporter
MTLSTAKSLPAWKKAMYALGQLGWSLAVFGVSNLINYFYFPAETKTGPAFPTFITQELFFGATIVGAVVFATRFGDAIIDPIVAAASDRANFRMGRRMPFLAVGAFFCALFSLLVFTPPVMGVSLWNAAWFAFTVVGFYFFFTVYTMPYFALLSEIAHTPEERLNLSTLTSITWALGFIAGNMTFALKVGLESKVLSWGFDPSFASVRSFQISLAILAVISMIFMYLPVIFIRERDYCEARSSNEDTWHAVVSTFKNRNFRLFAFSDLTYWVAMTTIQSTISYYIMVLLRLPEAFISQLLTILFVASFVFYAPVNILARKFGKRAVLIAAFCVFSLVFVFTGLLGKLPIPTMVQAHIIALAAAFPMAAFGILPGAMVADIADADGIQTGQFRAGMFFATRTFAMKLGTSLATLVLPTILTLGKSTENDLGVRLTAVVAFAFCLVGLFFITRVNEKEVLSTLNQRHRKEST